MQENKIEMKQQLVQPEDKYVEPLRKPLVNELEGSLCCPSALACFLSTIFPCAWLGACATVDERTERVLLNFGKYHATIREPGCYCWNPMGLQPRIISTSRDAIDLIHVKVADGRGNPLVVSGVVTYEIIETRKAALDVPDTKTYINTQGLAVMKKIASMYPYEAKDGGHSLKTEAGRLRTQLIDLLQERVSPAGVQIINFELTDLAYAPEIAQQMLIRQQAEVLVDARKIIVDGAMNIAHGALNGLANKGVRMTKEEESRLVTNLLVVICGDAKVQSQVSQIPVAGK